MSEYVRKEDVKKAVEKWRSDKEDRRTFNRLIDGMKGIVIDDQKEEKIKK